MLQAIFNGRYYWVPFGHLREIQFEKPADLRDVAWTPATLTFSNGGQSVALVPTRYPGSEGSSDSRLVLARSTEWIEHLGDTHWGSGQRIFATDQGEFPIMDVRSVKLAPQSASTSTGSG
jgi:type VI secretion system protein ImpE